MRPCTSVILPDDDRRRLRLAAAALGVSQGAIVREAVADRPAEIEGSNPDVARVLAAAA